MEEESYFQNGFHYFMKCFCNFGSFVRLSNLGAKDCNETFSFLILSVQDSGVGVEKELLECIFDPFVKANLFFKVPYFHVHIYEKKIKKFVVDVCNVYLM